MRTKENVINLIQEHAKAYRAENVLPEKVTYYSAKKLPEKWVDLEKGQLIDDGFRMDLHRQFTKLGAGFDKADWLDGANDELHRLTRTEISRSRNIISDVKVTEERIGGETVLHGYIKLNGEVLLNLKNERSVCHR